MDAHRIEAPLVGGGCCSGPFVAEHSFTWCFGDGVRAPWVLACGQNQTAPTCGYTTNKAPSCIKEGGKEGASGGQHLPLFHPQQASWTRAEVTVAS